MFNSEIKFSSVCDCGADIKNVVHVAQITFVPSTRIVIMLTDGKEGECME